MNASPEVSVIIPVYNTERYLRECLDSVVNQTLRDIEIICVDDGSTDGSPEILREYQAKDERITILRQEKSNAGAARNLGLSIAAGEYLSFLDSDDFFELEMLEHMVACAKNRDADIVVCEIIVYYEDACEAVPVKWHIRKELLPKKTVFSFCDIKRNAFRCIMPFPWAKLIKRDTVIKNGLRFQSQPVYNDAVFVYSAMLFAKRMTVLEEYLVYNRRRSVKNSITDTRHLHIDCVYLALSGLREYLTGKGVYDRHKRGFISYAISLMHHTYLGGKNDPTKEKEMQNKFELWLDEFAVKGHEPEYYYELAMYQVLLQEMKTQNADAESARLQLELDRLHKSLPFRAARLRSRLSGSIRAGFRCVREKGLRYTFYRLRKMLRER